MESINVVIDDFNDILGDSSEDEMDILTKNKEKQLLDTKVTTSGITPTGTVSAGSSGTTLKVTPEEQTSYETELEDERFDITEPSSKIHLPEFKEIIQLEIL